MAARQFYRKLCKDLPTIMEMYKLDELTSIGTLRNTLKELFYQNKKYTDPNVRQTTKRTQMLLFYLTFFSLTSLLSFVRSFVRSFYFKKKKITQMINVMVHKANEELQLILRMHKQRHHVVCCSFSSFYSLTHSLTLSSFFLLLLRSQSML